MSNTLDVPLPRCVCFLNLINLRLETHQVRLALGIVDKGVLAEGKFVCSSIWTWCSPHSPVFVIFEKLRWIVVEASQIELIEVKDLFDFINFVKAL